MIRATMTGQQAEALARYLVTLRPGQSAWTKTAVFDQLTIAARERSNDTEHLTHAALRATLDPTIVTPDVISMPGRHWEGLGAVSNAAGRAVPDRCPRCRSVSCSGTDENGDPLCAPPANEIARGDKGWLHQRFESAKAELVEEAR